MCGYLNATPHYELSTTEKNRKHFHLGNFLVVSESKQHVWLAAHGGGGRDLLPGVPLQPLLRHGHRGTRVPHINKTGFKTSLSIPGAADGVPHWARPPGHNAPP